MYQRGLFLLVILATGGCLTHLGVAAPVVKKLGDPTNNNYYSNFQEIKTPQVQTSTITNRAPAIRVSGAATKSVSKTVGGTQTVSTTPKSGTYIDATRKSGLHNNLIKGVGSKLSSSSPSGGGGATSDLIQRITNLEQEMATKQEILDAGDGIDITGNTIGLMPDISDLPTRIDEMAQEIDDLNEKVDGAGLSNDYWTAEETQDYLEQHYYTAEYVNQIINQIKPNVVNDFDPGFLHASSGQVEQP